MWTPPDRLRLASSFLLRLFFLRIARGFWILSKSAEQTRLTGRLTLAEHEVKCQHQRDPYKHSAHEPSHSRVA